MPDPCCTAPNFFLNQRRTQRRNSPVIQIKRRKNTETNYLQRWNGEKYFSYAALALASTVY
jgi:hypothetical protein